MSVALTQNVNYQLKPTSVRAKRKTIVLPSSNKTTFTPGNTCVWYLPSLANQVVDGQSAYLRFSATITGNGFVDNTAHSFVDRTVTYGAGGSLIDDIQNYGVLANTVTDLQLAQSDKIGLSGLLGTEEEYGVSTVASVGTNGSGVQVNAGAFPSETLPTEAPTQT